jgi:hypothetical protein
MWKIPGSASSTNLLTNFSRSTPPDHSNTPPHNNLLLELSPENGIKISEFKKLPNTAFPDLKNPKTGVGIEVKATMRDPWSTVGHNVTSGCFLTIEYDIDENGLPNFRTVWIGELTEKDFTWRGRSEKSRRTITASVKKESWDKKMKKYLKELSES